MNGDFQDVVPVRVRAVRQLDGKLRLDAFVRDNGDDLPDVPNADVAHQPVVALRRFEGDVPREEPGSSGTIEHVWCRGPKDLCARFRIVPTLVDAHVVRPELVVVLDKNFRPRVVVDDNAGAGRLPTKDPVGERWM